MSKVVRALQALLWRLSPWMLGALLLITPAIHAQQRDASRDSLKEQRRSFIAAERALARGQGAKFRRLLATLESYPLHPYLVYAALRRRLHIARPEEVRRFLNEHADGPLAPRLRTAWLAQLAKRGQWVRFLSEYQESDNVVMRCRRLRGLLATGEREASLNGVPELWMVGHSQPKACDAIFAVWLRSPGFTPALAWARFGLAMRAGEVRLARYLQRFLNDDDRALARLWLGVHYKPRRVLKVSRTRTQPERVEEMLIHGLRRLARDQPDEAASAWDIVRQRFAASLPGVAAIQRRLALAYAYRHQGEALDWFEKLAEPMTDAHARSWRIAAALRQTDWRRASAWIARLSREERGESRWRYWHARVLEAMGQAELARPIFESLALDRGYYSFLAADRIGRAYELGHQPLPVSDSALRKIEQIPGAKRAYELLHLKRRTDARREWRELTRDMDSQSLAAAAELAHRWGWHGRAILTVAQTPYRDDLELRFPLAYRKRIEREAARQKIDPAWIFAIVRQESAFMPDARSPKGALGLMQIMPRTGRGIARSLNTTLRNRHQLLEAATSLRYGSRYLRTLLERQERHPVLATVAYNAGIHRARRWRPETAAMNALLWIENIPFTETRRYVRRVFAYMVVYEHRLGRTPQRLSERLQPIPARATQTAYR